MADEDASQYAKYPNSMITNEGLKNDVISSVLVPQGYSVMLYDRGDLTGDSKV